MKIRVFPLVLGSLLACSVNADDNAVNPVLVDPFTFKLGISRLKADGTFSSTLNNRPSDKISTGDLGVDDTSTGGYFAARWRFTERWRLSFDYFGQDRERSVSRNFDDLDFGDIEASGFLTVDTQLKTDFYVVQVGYSLLKNDRAELGIGGGVHFVNFATELTVTGGINDQSGSVQSDSEDLLAPLPNILGYGIYAFTPKLSVDGSVGWFGLDYDEYSGDLITFTANLEYRLTEHFGLGVGYNYVQMDLEIEQSRRTDAYDLNYSGPVAYVSASF